MPPGALSRQGAVVHARGVRWGYGGKRWAGSGRVPAPTTTPTTERVEETDCARETSCRDARTTRSPLQNHGGLVPIISSPRASCSTDVPIPLVASHEYPRALQDRERVKPILRIIEFVRHIDEARLLYALHQEVLGARHHGAGTGREAYGADGKRP